MAPTGVLEGLEEVEDRSESMPEKGKRISQSTNRTALHGDGVIRKTFGSLMLCMASTVVNRIVKFAKKLAHIHRPRNRSTEPCVPWSGPKHESGT